jgi:hypothetical protein
VLGVAWEQPLERLPASDSARVMQRLSRTGFGTGLNLGSGSLTLDNTLVESRAWGELTRWRGRHETLLGYEWSTYRVRYDVDAPAAGGDPIFQVRQNPTAGALYVDHTVRLASITARAGLRAETVTGTDWIGLSPRLSLKWFANEDLAFTLAGGRTTQWTPALRNEQAPVRIFDFWLTSDRDTPVAEAWQTSGGVERWFGSTLRAARGVSQDVRSPAVLEPVQRSRCVGTSSSSRPVNRTAWTCCCGSSSAGAVRVDCVLVRCELARRRRRSLCAGAGSAAQPQRGVVLSARWFVELRLRLGLGTGTPFTDVVGQLVRRRYDPLTNSFSTGNREPVSREPIGGVRNAARFPLFQRLDLSVTRTSTGKRTWAPYLSLINAYNARNVFTYVFDYVDNPPTRTAISQFPCHSHGRRDACHGDASALVGGGRCPAARCCSAGVSSTRRTCVAACVGGGARRAQSRCGSEQVILVESSLTGRVAIDSDGCASIRSIPFVPRVASRSTAPRCDCSPTATASGWWPPRPSSWDDGTGRYVVPRTRLAIVPGRALSLAGAHHRWP